MSTNQKTYRNEEVLSLLGEIYKIEASGINRYMHYSFMIMGYNRIPIQKWFRDNASESMAHSILIGEKITSLGGHPPLIANSVEESNLHTVQNLLEETLKFEEEAVLLYTKLSAMAADLGDIALEEMARTFVMEETEHVDEVRKMMRKPDSH